MIKDNVEVATNYRLVICVHDHSRKRPVCPRPRRSRLFRRGMVPSRRREATHRILYLSCIRLSHSKISVRVFCFGRCICHQSLCLPHVRSRKLTEIGTKFRSHNRKSSSMQIAGLGTRGTGTCGTGTAELGHAELGQRDWDMRNWDSFVIVCMKRM